MKSKAIQYLQKARACMDSEKKEFLVLVVYKAEKEGVKTNVEGQAFFRSDHPEILAKLVTAVAKTDKGLEILLDHIERIRERERLGEPLPQPSKLILPMG